MSNCTYINPAHNVGDAPDQKGWTLYLMDEHIPVLVQQVVFSPDQP